MNGFLPEVDENGNAKPIYNPNDFNKAYGYATYADLLDYANIFRTNIFYSINFFTNGLQFNGNLNNVSDTVFNYLTNVSSDIQTQFNNIFLKLTNYIYHQNDNTQTILTNLDCPNIAVNDLESNNIINNNITSNNIKTNNLYVDSLKCNNFQSNSIVNIYFLNNNALYPVLKSGLLSKFNAIDNTKPLYITIAPKYKIIFYNSLNIPQVVVSNNTSDFIYYQSINITNINYFTIFNI